MELTLLIKVNRDMFIFLLIRFTFTIPENNFSFKKYLAGMILAFFNTAIFDKYFGVLGSDFRARPPVCLTIESPSWDQTFKFLPKN